MFIVTLVLNELVAWMRRQGGTSSLRALLYMDEIFGYFPPTANPPSKLPMLTLLKQARAFGLGVVLATQNPVDLDYRGLSNCGTWLIGRLQTERDRLRVVQGLTTAQGGDALDQGELGRLMSALKPRVFLLRNAREDAPPGASLGAALSAWPPDRPEIARLMARASRGPRGQPAAQRRPDCGGAAAAAATCLMTRAGTAVLSIESPMIAGSAKLHFVDAKLGSIWQTALVAPPP
jgi:hypothetical protein